MQITIYFASRVPNMPLNAVLIPPGKDTWQAVVECSRT